MNITEIRNQSWSGLLNIFYICLQCDHVSGQGLPFGYRCKRCGHPSGVRMFYNVVIPSLIDSIQELYFLTEPTNLPVPAQVLSPLVNSRTVIPLLFCTLAEVTLEHLLDNIMRKHGLSLTERKRHLREHLTGMKRRMKLFPQLTNVRWEEALKEASTSSTTDFPETFQFYLRVNKARNRFLHDGIPWAIKPNDGEECIGRIWPLLQLIVALHNRFVCKLIS